MTCNVDRLLVVGGHGDQPPGRGAPGAALPAAAAGLLAASHLGPRLQAAAGAVLALDLGALPPPPRRDQRQAPRHLQPDGRGQAAAGAGRVAHQAGVGGVMAWVTIRVLQF